MIISALQTVAVDSEVHLFKMPGLHKIALAVAPNEWMYFFHELEN